MKEKFNTFRVRLICLMVSLSGVALFAFGFGTWRVLYSERITTLDLELESLAYQYAEPFVFEAYRPPGHLPPAKEYPLIESFNYRDVEMILLRQDGEVIRQSSNWDSDIDHTPFLKYAEQVEGSLENVRITPRGMTRHIEGSPPRGPGGGGPRGPVESRGPRPPRGPDDGNRKGPRPGPGGARPEEAGSAGFSGGPRGQGPGGPGAGGPRMSQILKLNAGILADVECDHDHWRIMAVPAPAHVILVARSTNPIRTEMKDLGRAFLLALPVALVFIGAGASWIASQAIKPVNQLSESAEKTTAQGLDHRIPEQGTTGEFKRLVKVYNAMLSRLETSFNQASRFSADAAHELNTPITILMGHLDDALQDAEPNSDEQERFGLLLQEVQRLKGIVDKLLLLSRADSGQLRGLKEKFSMSDLVSEVADDAHEIAPELSLDRNIPEGICIEGDPELMRQIVFNLTSNAIKYNQSGGSLSLNLTVDNSEQLVYLTVANSGKAIPEDAADHIFDRFYRVDPTRNRKVHGLGLGLPLAKEFTELHGGTLALTENREGQVAFTLSLPMATN